MKKTLIALAAVAATGAAFAQSSVTLYGVADVAVGDNNVAGTKLRALANGGYNNGNSRLGVRGTEDLGGGLKAVFNFEQGINIANGATDANTFQRAAFVGLTGGFGEIHAGRRLTPHFFAKAAYELTGTANYSVLASQFGYGGATRRDAMVTYKTPNMGGFTATIGHVLEGNNAAKPFELNAIYAAGPLTVAFGYDKSSGAKASTSLGGKYDFGGFVVAGSYQNSAGGNGRKGFTVGASANVGPVTLTGDIARATNAGFKNTDFLLEAKYPLSKRTFVYAIYQRDGGIGGAASVNGYALGLRHNF